MPVLAAGNSASGCVGQRALACRRHPSTEYGSNVRRAASRHQATKMQGSNKCWIRTRGQRPRPAKHQWIERQFRGGEAGGKILGGPILAGKGLGLGLGLGPWGPIILGVVGAAAIYAYIKTLQTDVAQSDEEVELRDALA